MTLRGDDRAQSVQVGAILLFGFLILAFTGYQAAVVPQQNGRVEFQHSQSVANDVQTFRNNLLDAAATGRRASTEFTLGTNYPPRALAINPAAASGQLRTESMGGGNFTLVAGDLSLEDVCGYDRDGDGSVPSKGLVYSPSYNVYDEAPTVVYENTVTYRRYESEGVVRLDANQTLIQGTKITIPPLVGNVSESGSQTKTVDLFPGKAGVGDSVGQSITLVVPTDLSADRWRTLLSDQMTTAGGKVDSVTQNGSNVDINLVSAEYTITCPVVGTGQTPENSPDRLRGASGGINPGGAGDVRLSGISRHPNNKDLIVLSFTNPGDDVNVSSARFNFYESANDAGPNRLDLFRYDLANNAQGVKTIEDLYLRGPSKSPNPNVKFTGDDDVTGVLVEFESASSDPYSPSEKDFAVVHLQFSDGQRANYFVDIPPNN